MRSKSRDIGQGIDKSSVSTSRDTSQDATRKLKTRHHSPLKGDGSCRDFSSIRLVSDADLLKEAVRRWPGRKLPKHWKPPETEILAAVLSEMDTTGNSQWRACCRVAGRLHCTPRGIWGIVQRRRLQPRCAHPRMDPEYGGR
jgi:hypothetical protein